MTDGQQPHGRNVAVSAVIHDTFNLAVHHYQAGNLREAEQCCRQVLAIDPDHADTLHFLGVIAGHAGKNDVAVDLIRRALAIKPDFAEAWCNLGSVLRHKGDLDAAIAAYRRAVAIAPNLAEAHSHLGMSLGSKGQMDDALAATRRAIALDPTLPEAHHSLAGLLKDCSQLDEAIASYRQTLALRPDHLAAHSNLLYTLYFHPACDGRMIADEHRSWARRHADPLTSQIKTHSNNREPERRLRVGYVSPDFRGHVVGRFLLQLLANHDHRNFEVFAYAYPRVPDAMTQRLRSQVDVWRGIADLSDAQAADLIRQDGIDILIDLTLHMGNNRLLIFARKPAPVQVTYLAYAGTSGLKTMDYRLSDPWLDPVGGDESAYSEQTIRLPETYLCYLPVPGFPCHPPPALGTGFITFGCLNNFCKVNEPLLDLWARLLVTVPRSRLVLHPHEGSHRQRVLEHLQRRGVEPSRVSFVGQVPAEVYFESYHSIDIALDTAPYAGGTTTCDALWMGVPVVSLAGGTAVGRQGLSILSNIGLPELVASTPEEYVRIAADLAGDIPRLRELRSTLRQRMERSPLMDAPRFARNMEGVYRRMWRTWCEKAVT